MGIGRIPGVELCAGVVVDSPVANLHTTKLQIPVVGSAWPDENHSDNRVAQLYGGYVLPGSRFDIQGGIGVMVSQWNTAVGWPYRAMQFKAALRDTTKTTRPPDPINL
jgi:D-arabinan endo alpha-(1,5)-arabinofuranosidase